MTHEFSPDGSSLKTQNSGSSAALSLELFSSLSVKNKKKIRMNAYVIEETKILERFKKLTLKGGFKNVQVQNPAFGWEKLNSHSVGNLCGVPVDG
jgi:hypothetical protein